MILGIDYVRNALFWSSLPFVIPQAIKMKRSTPRFVGAGGEPFGNVGSGDTLRLVGLGDSIIAGVGATSFELSLTGQTAKHIADRFQSRVEWQAIGKIGAMSEKVADHLLPLLPDEQVNFFLVSAGVNDVIALKTIPQFRVNLERILKTLQEHSPMACVALLGVPPLSGFPFLPSPLKQVIGFRGREFDGVAIETVTKHENVIHVPLVFEPRPELFSKDGLHPSEESYSAIAEKVAERLGLIRSQ